MYQCGFTKMPSQKSSVLFKLQSRRYGDLFKDAWKAFTDHEHTSLLPYAGQRVCISDATFAFLPRMMLGLFYNTPVVRLCHVFVEKC